MAIFERAWLRPSQLRTVADRRFGDAVALCETGQNARANGAMYLGGFVVECLLKAKLLEHYPWLQGARSPQGRSKDEQYLWSLCYRRHDLGEILDRLPAITEKLARLEQQDSNQVLHSLRDICNQWTVHARYSPFSETINEARTFLDQVKEFRPWLR